jgi:4-hydroxy-3-polyprenylbenzoate decarboxylase
MSFSSLQSFTKYLEKIGQLKKIKTPVSTNLEITEIQSRVIAKGGPALLFENVNNENNKKFNIPILVNLFGTVERIALGIKRKPNELRKLGEMLAFLRQPKPPEGLKEAFNMIPLIKSAIAMKPRLVEKAPCQEVVLTKDEIDLNSLPIQNCWPNEPAPLITWPIVITKGSGEDQRDKTNLGIYRMQVIDKDTTLMRWLRHRGGAGQYMRWKNKYGTPFPAAVVIGTDPATIISAVMPVPDNLSEYQFSGLLRGEKLPIVKCKTVPLHVPANAEIILEGHVLINEDKDEGPYGDHTGYYNSVEKFPIFKVSAITMRKSPIYLSTYTGRPPDEPSILGEALNEIFIPLIQQQFPEIIDFWLPPEGCSYRVAVVSIKKQYPGHAKRIMMGIWSFLRQFIYTKFVIIVDDDINVRSWTDVVWALSTRADPSKDITIIKNTPIDYLDFASPLPGLGGKMGIDATNKLYPETTREWGKKIQMDEEIKKLVTEKWENYGLDL